MTSIDKHFHWRLSHDLQKNQLRSTVDVTALLRPLPRHLPMVLFDAQVSPSPDNSDNTLEHIGTHHGQLCQSTSFSHLFTVRRSVCHTRHTLLDFSRIVGSCHFWRQHCPFEVWVSAELRTNRAKSSLLSGPPQIEPELNRDWEMKWDEQRRFPPLNSRTCAIVCYCMGMDKIHSSSRRNPTIHNFHYFPGTCGMQQFPLLSWNMRHAALWIFISVLFQHLSASLFSLFKSWVELASFECALLALHARQDGVPCGTSAVMKVKSRPICIDYKWLQFYYRYYSQL